MTTPISTSFCYTNSQKLGILCPAFGYFLTNQFLSNQRYSLFRTTSSAGVADSTGNFLLNLYFYRLGGSCIRSCLFLRMVLMRMVLSTQMQNAVRGRKGQQLLVDILRPYKAIPVKQFRQADTVLVSPFRLLATD